ncbi:ABC transporter permease [Alkalilacustris brevis]|uniref:ABC transporter permease n=1 Tax=Alkalilacustris brevis TaxID=2026338 RepID=UPI001EE3CEA6|nr:ABC transporter permease subunit [Alkalilacustris brevis]
MSPAPELRAATHSPVGPVAFAPGVTVLLLAAPVLAGLAGVVLPAFGWQPVLGGRALTLDPWRTLADWPGLPRAIWLSLSTGFAATAVSLAITLLLTAAWHGTRTFDALMRLLSPLLSVPHAAAAFGLAFLIAPSGWIARIISPWATGWERPPDLLLVNDPAGVALTLGLIAKEVPFLLLMTLAALAQIDSQRSLRVARSMGYGRVAGWAKTVLPAVYRQIRLPVYAVLAYSMSVVDMALILGPTRPPTLAVQVLEWITSPDLANRFNAAAGALLQALLVAGALVFWWLGERVAARLGRRWAEGGARHLRADTVLRPLALFAAGTTALAVLAGLAALALWSVAGLWQFPDPLPRNVNLRTWAGQVPALGRATGETLLIGLVTTLLAITLVIACLEADHRRGRLRRGASWLLPMIYLPLLVPQIAFLPGLQTFALMAGMDSGRVVVIAAHLVFVLPYVFLSLSDPWRAWDRRHAVAAATLGARPSRVLWAVRLPMLLRAALVAAAVGFAVSVAQYLPTLVLGGGRIETLTTEAVALASGANRRVIGVFAVAQMLLPMLGFLLALGLPALVFRNRKGVWA